MSQRATRLDTPVNQFLCRFRGTRTLPPSLFGGDMSSQDRPRGNSSGPRSDAVPAATPTPSNSHQDPYSSWLDRMQRARARHAAITKNLHTWSNYKNWADQVKDSWDEEEAKKK